MDGFWHASNNFWERARAKQLSKELIDKTWKNSNQLIIDVFSLSGIRPFGL